MSGFRPAAAYAPCDDLWVVTTYYNPAGYRTKRINYERFAAPLRAAGIPFVTAECTFGAEPFELAASPHVIQVRGRDVMWMKERLINLAIAQLPATATKVAWLDADILFANPAWAQQTAAGLNRWPIVQPCDSVGRLSRSQTIFRGASRRGFACQLQRRPESAFLRSSAHGQPGIAWAARRSLIEKHGVYDAAILDGGDELFSHALGGGFASPCVCGITGAWHRHWPWLIERLLNHLARLPWPHLLADAYVRRALARSPRPAPAELFYAHYLRWAQVIYAEVRGQIGCVPGMALHLWHGDPLNRQYGSRNAILKRHNFDPLSDLRLNEQGVWEWAVANPNSIKKSTTTFTRGARMNRPISHCDSNP